MLHFFLKPKHRSINYILLFFISIFFSKTTIGQSQTAFVRNDRANPLQRFMVASGRLSHPVFVDIDNDGDMDCFSGEFNYNNNSIASSYLYFFKNEGDAGHPSFKEMKNEENPLHTIAITGLIIPCFADIDNDGDEDCFIADNSGAISFYENAGTAKRANFEKQSAAFNPLSLVKLSGIDISNFILNDADADGDLDCLVTDADGNEAYFRNAGSIHEPYFVNTNKSADPFAFINNTAINNISLYDWNRDGRTDIFINEKYYQNNSGHFSTASIAPSINNKNNVASCWVDLDNDGTPEIVSGTSDGKFTYSTVVTGNVKAAITSIKVSPNPATKSFTVYLSQPVTKTILKIVNADGKIMSLQNIHSSNYTFGDNFTPGIYFVQIISSNIKVAEQKIVKL